LVPVCARNESFLIGRARDWTVRHSVCSSPIVPLASGRFAAYRSGGGRRAGGTMRRNPLVILLLCAGLFATLMMPLGRAIFPHVSPYLGEWPFDTIEAMMGATLAFAVSALICG
jgi:hypothetical protein